MRAAISVYAGVLLSVVVAACGGGSSGKPAKTGGEGEEGSSSSSSGSKMPGDCVDPVSDGDHHDSTKPFDKHVQLDVRDEDLDGDGVIDVFVKPGWSCGESCIRSVYIQRGTCAHYVGSFPSMDNFGSAETKSNGLKDILTRPRRMEDDGQTHCYQVLLKFNGTEYKEAKRRECECKDEGSKCAAWNE
jgi:hypothetical protein